MSYHVYHTEALFLGAYEVGEGDRLFHCYTRDFGLLLVRARSVREIRSRLRYALQTFAHTEIDLVRGKSGWRLISARPIFSFRPLWEDAAKRRIVAQYTSLIRRLIQGEERHAELFEDILRGLFFLGKIETRGNLENAELLLVIRLINLLGYWGDHERFQPLFQGEAWRAEHLSTVGLFRGELLKEVNQALSLSNL